MAYDATQVIIKALERSNTRQELQVRQELQKVLSSPSFSVNGATGKIEFLKSGDRDGKSILVKVQPSGTGYDFVRLNP
jgi:branched-chain amino acid transport system substrate-binding protein